MSTNPIVLPPSKLPPRALQMAFVDQNGVLTDYWQKTLGAFLTAMQVQKLLTGTHAQKALAPATGYAPGSLYFETDRGVYYINQGSAWVYFAGIWTLTQVDLAAIPAGDLGIEDSNLLAYVSDFAHLLVWNVNTWGWAPAEMGSGMQETFPDAATRPPGTGWHVCDGSTVPVLNPDGSYAMVTVPVVGATTFYRQ